MSNLNVPKVMVVDDNPATRYSTGRVLKNAGFAILEASTGAEALKIASKGPDVIVLDVNLPDMDGFQVCRELRSIELFKRTPVIHLSATFTSDVDKVKGLEAGADGYLTHPVEPLVLVATVNAFIRARKAEDGMLTSEAKFKSIFDQVADGLALFNKDLAFEEINQSLLQILKMKRDAVLGQRLIKFAAPADQNLLKQIALQLESQNSWQGSFPLTDSTGRNIEIDWRFCAHSDPGIWLAIALDATERIRVETEREQLLESERVARAAAERANHLKDDFLATLSHELRTPLSAIVGWAQVLKYAGVLPEHELAEGVAAIERNAKIQTQLIDDLLDVSRITSGKLHLEVKPVNLSEIAEGALESLAPAIRAKEVEVIRHFASDTGAVTADASRLQQVIWNLISNAVKFSKPGGSIVVTAQGDDSAVELSVIDHGSGIATDFLPHIFERFRQEDASSTRKHGGLGLGLSIVKHLVELHGGTVRAHSEGPGTGAEFIIRLPVTSNTVPDQPSIESQLSSGPDLVSNYLAAGNIAGTKVLVVDDDADTRVLLQRLLRDCHVEVTTAASVAEALEYVEQIRPQILISDIGMPNRNGYDLMREIRDRGIDLHRLPAIALTAFARSEDRRKALHAGFQLHLKKPVNPAELVSAISSLLRKPQVTNEAH
ncbi:response regulator [Schlesneria sp. T3-172]|uniref:response regulator n=1 Tax=Schlesneria sphaerica TaxID=3373610 RepID=UPI0037C812E8